MRRNFKFTLSCLLLGLVMVFLETDLGYTQPHKASSQTKNPAPGEQAVGINAEYEKFLQKFKESPPQGMVLIPAGTFMMGSTRGDRDEKPIHEVT
ncbi:MAG: hypothetical protein QF732_11555, partial [Nitrospinaceae bacterium]|nr:hypothetical protein [Nitrospinaceae bacterium]